MENGEVMFRHFRNKNQDGSISNLGGATVAFEKIDEKTLKVAMAFCHPQENFIKKEGRVKSAGRLNSKNYAVTLNVDVPTFHKVCNETTINDFKDNFGI